nr:SDR family NAD(P)-dependent oxidoreductase [Sebaldella sp.]
MNKVALVVGGGQTLGAFLSEGLAKEGYDVVVADLNQESAVGTAKDIEGKYKVSTLGVKVDAANEDDVNKMMDAIKEKFGRVDLLVYSAGIARSYKITNFPLADWNLSMAVNTTGYFLCARE